MALALKISGGRPMHRLWDLIKVLPTFAMSSARIGRFYAHAARRVA